jgi:hypothetical protein
MEVSHAIGQRWRGESKETFDMRRREIREMEVQFASQSPLPYCIHDTWTIIYEARPGMGPLISESGETSRPNTPRLDWKEKWRGEDFSMHEKWIMMHQEEPHQLMHEEKTVYLSDQSTGRDCIQLCHCPDSSLPALPGRVLAGQGSSGSDDEERYVLEGISAPRCE